MRLPNQPDLLGRRHGTISIKSSRILPTKFGFLHLMGACSHKHASFMIFPDRDCSQLWVVYVIGVRALLAVITDNTWTKLTRYFWVTLTGTEGTVIIYLFQLEGSESDPICDWGYATRKNSSGGEPGVWCYSSMVLITGRLRTKEPKGQSAGLCSFVCCITGYLHCHKGDLLFQVSTSTFNYLPHKSNEIHYGSPLKFVQLFYPLPSESDWRGKYNDWQ